LIKTGCLETAGFLRFSRKPRNPKKQLELAGADHTCELFDCGRPDMNFAAERLTPKAIGIEGARIDHHAGFHGNANGRLRFSG